MIKDEPKDIPLLSYVFACNPNTDKEERANYADVSLHELRTHKDQWKSPHKKSFAGVLIWDVRELATDKKALSELGKFYFKGDETNEKYQDILAVLGVESKNIDQDREHLEALEKIFEGYDRFDTPEEDKQIYYKKVSDYLGVLEPELLKEVVVNVKNKELAKRCFVYLWLNDIEDKKETLVSLFISIDFASHDIDEKLFGAHFPQLIKNEDDPNLEIAKAFLSLPEDAFLYDSQWEDAIKAAASSF
ncbi:MAG: hypothetical protein ACK5ME_09045 [Parahaliea sp.]